MRTTHHAPGRLITAVTAGLVIASISAAAQDSSRAIRELPAPTDIDPRLTEVLQRLEQNLAEAILHRDAESLERLVHSQYTLRIADVPQGSMSRAIWMDNALNRLQPDSVGLHHCTARKLAENLAVVSLIYQRRASMEGRDVSGEFYVVDLWQRTTGTWQIVARYSSPVGHPAGREDRPLPPPTDVDPELTMTLAQLEQQLGDAARGGYRDTNAMGRLVGSEFTLRTSDAPERSLPRALWGQPSGRYKIESLDERYHAARKLTDDVAVVSLLLTQKASVDGRDRSGDFYVVDIWKQRGDRWQLIARYSSPLGKKFDRMAP